MGFLVHLQKHYVIKGRLNRAEAAMTAAYLNILSQYSCLCMLFISRLPVAMGQWANNMLPPRQVCPLIKHYALPVSPLQGTLVQ